MPPGLLYISPPLARSSFSHTRTYVQYIAMDLKSCVITLVLLFLLLAVPSSSASKERLESEVYEIDYRGPETHSHRPPPNRGNTNNGVPRGHLKKHQRFKRQPTRNAIKKVKKLKG
uniref:uncharacterized protein LOC122582500 n=1 Tax=Erigeron canadensis TaxID=72917 RepID=UPI001CB9770D|nr:uncharacterized protein LOC122582500 [Erigeron canadensis]